MSQESHDLGPVPTLTLLAGYGDSYVVPGDEVYVVAEDCDYIYQNTGSNPVADGFNIIKAIFLAGVWQRRDAGAGASGLRFNTVAIGALGSGRLIDADIVGLVDGTSTAWVESVRDTWRWDATSTATADNITVCNPTANGVNPGRFIRELIASPSWMLTNHNWFIRPSTGSDENDGLTDLTALASSGEFQRRTGCTGGQKPEWGPGDYHIYLPEGAGTIAGQNVRFYLSAKRSQTNIGSAFAFNTTIYVHGNAVAGQGFSTIFPTSGTALVDAVTAQDSATNQTLQITCNAVPVSWTASGLISLPGTTTSSLARRGRIIASSVPANVGGTFWPKEDLGAQTAMLDYPAVPNTYSGNFVLNTGTFTPAAGDSFIIENLVFIQAVIDVDPSVNVIFESCALGINEIHGSFVTVDKSQIAPSVAQTSIGLCDRAQINGTRVAGGTSTSSDMVLFRFADLFNCNVDGSVNLQCLETGNITRLFVHGLSSSIALYSASKAQPSTSASRNRGWTINSIGIVNTTSIPVAIADNAELTALTEVWGSGNSFPPFMLRAGAKLTWPSADIFGGAPPASYFYINIAGGPWIGNDQAGGNGYAAPAYDTATSLFTARRTLSAANLQATVAAGGFNGRFFDPVTMCAMVAAQQG